MTSGLSRSRKRELRALNQQAWTGRTDVYPVKPPLDTSLKKNTAVIKRLRTSLTADNQASLLKDISTVSLEKYLPEIISAITEGLLKVKVAGEISTAVEIVSALHQRFCKSFTPYIIWNLAKGLSTPTKDHLRGLALEQKEKEETARLTRQRALLRVAADLWLVGVVRTSADALNPDEGSHGGAGAKGTSSEVRKVAVKVVENGESDPFPLEVIKDLLARDREGVNLSLVTLFLKNFAWDVLGIKARSTARKDDTADAPEVNGKITDDNDASLTNPNLQTRFKTIFEQYFQALSNHMVSEHRRLQSQAKRNAEAYIRSGEVFDDRQQAFEKATKSQEKLIANAQIVAETLGLDMPRLGSEDEEKESGEGMIRESGSMFKKGDDTDGSGMWEDEDQKKFYEDLPDLKLRLPALLLTKGATGEAKEQDNKKEATNGTTKATDEDALVAKTEELTLGSPILDTADLVIPNKTIGAQVDGLLVRLPESTNRELIDTFAYEFCLVNSKASQNRLIRVLTEIPRGRSDLLPFYARLCATLDKAGIANVQKLVIDYLTQEFKSLQRRKAKDNLGQVRNQNARYLAEMIKFGIVPEHTIFHCFKVALEDFTRTNIDIICNLLEGCGKYLLRSPATQERMQTFLETLQRKKSAQHLGQQERILIENAFYTVNPPERAAIQVKQRPVMEIYIRKLIYLDLNKKNYNKVVKSLRKLHWEDPEISAVMTKLCSKIWKVRYSNVHLMAIVVVGLFRYHQEFGISVVDRVLEDIRRGLETNDFRMSQRRVANARYLGELYNYKMVDSPVIFDQLYLILNYGYNGTPQPGVFCPMDPPDDCFRIRLVCTLLDTCGMCFDRGSARKKLDFFLAYFQYFYHLKQHIPMDIEFMVQDTFAAIRPNWKLHATLEEAGKAFQEAADKIFQTTRPGDKSAEAEPEEASDSEDDAEDEDVASDDEQDVDHEVQTVRSTDNAIVNGSSHSDTEDESDSEGEVVVTRPEQVRDPQEEADFDREFNKMMTESLDSRKFEKLKVLDIVIPIRKAAPVLGTNGYADEETGVAGFEDHVPQNKPSTVGFTLLMKSKGNRPQTHTLNVSSDSALAIKVKAEQESEREQRLKIKNVVLNLNDREESNELDELKSHAASNGVHVRYGDKIKHSQRSRKLQPVDYTESEMTAVVNSHRFLRALVVYQPLSKLKTTASLSSVVSILEAATQLNTTTRSIPMPLKSILKVCHEDVEKLLSAARKPLPVPAERYGTLSRQRIIQDCSLRDDQHRQATPSDAPSRYWSVRARKQHATLQALFKAIPGENVLIEASLESLWAIAINLLKCDPDIHDTQAEGVYERLIIAEASRLFYKQLAMRRGTFHPTEDGFKMPVDVHEHVTHTGECCSCCRRNMPAKSVHFNSNVLLIKDKREDVSVCANDAAVGDVGPNATVYFSEFTDDMYTAWAFAPPVSVFHVELAQAKTEDDVPGIEMPDAGSSEGGWLNTESLA